MKALGWGGKGGKDSDALRKVEVKTVKVGGVGSDILFKSHFFPRIRQF